MPALQPRLAEHPELPYVFDTRVTVKQTAAYILGAKITLPVDVVNDSKPGYEEYTFPATKHVPPEWTDKLVDISELDDVGRIAFKGIKKVRWLFIRRAQPPNWILVNGARHVTTIVARIFFPRAYKIGFC